MKTIEETARELRNAYQREWRKNHPEKVKASNSRYWERKARAAAEREKKVEVHV